MVGAGVGEGEMSETIGKWIGAGVMMILSTVFLFTVFGCVSKEKYLRDTEGLAMVCQKCEAVYSKQIADTNFKIQALKRELAKCQLDKK
jgi:hypothetical protein